MRFVWMACSMVILATCSSAPKLRPEPVTEVSKGTEPPRAAEPQQAPAAEFSMDSLPEWPLAEESSKSDAPSVEVHAADVGADALFSLLYNDKTPVLRATNKQTLSGRIKGTRSQALHALLSAHPSLKPALPPTKTKTYRGRALDIQYYDASSTDVLRLLADIGGVNLVAPADAAKKLTVFAIGMPWDQLLDLVGAELGLSIHGAEKHSRFLAASGYKPDLKLIKKGKGWLELDAREVSASLLASTIAELSGLDYSIPCDARAVSLRLRRSKAGTALAAIELLSGSKLSKGKTRCPAPPAILTRALKPDDRLLATFFTGNNRRILIQDSLGAIFYSEDAKAIRMHPTFVGQGDVVLPPRDKEVIDVPNLDGARLAATVLQNDGAAITVQNKDGSFQNFRSNVVGYKLEVGPGKATFSGPGLKATTLQLRPAAP